MKKETLKDKEANNRNKKRKEMAKKPEIEDYIIYFTVGALAGKFVEVLLNIQPDKLWWVSFISGGILGLIVLNRKRLSK